MTRYKYPHPDDPDNEDSDVDVEYVVNPLGAVADVPAGHEAATFAPRREGGWQLASEEQIRAHAKRTGSKLPRELEKGGSVRPAKASSSG